MAVGRLRRLLQAHAGHPVVGRGVKMARVVRDAVRRPGTLSGLPRAILLAVLRTPIARPARAPSGPSSVERAVAARRASAAAAIATRAATRAPVEPRGLRMACVADDWLAAGLAPECELVPVRPDAWRAVLEAAPPDVLLIQAAWRGEAGAWQYKVAWFAHHDALGLADLRALVGWCAARDVPTVFWDTEGLLRFETFRDAAALVDVIFTVDPAAVPHYLELAERRAVVVEVLPHAVRPDLHHPGAAPSPARPVFVGSFHRGLDLDRRAALEGLLDVAVEAGATIHDTEAGADDPAFGLPERFRGLEADRVPEAALADVYRAASVVLVDAPSQTIVPRRLLEALVCGRPVATTACAVAAARFGGAVVASDDPGVLRAALARLAVDPDAAMRIAGTAGPLLREHTYAHRLASIARAAGIVVSGP